MRPLRRKQLPVTRTARSPARENALVMDYETLNGGTNDFTFQGDTTYFISGLFVITNNTTLEGGTVIKYATNSNAALNVSNLVLQTSPYRPAVFTSQNDDSVGEQIGGSTGNPWGDNAGLMALYFPNQVATLDNVRFSHLAAGVSFESGDDGGGSLTMNDFQVVDCAQAVMSVGASCSVFNGLVYSVSNLFGHYGEKANAVGQTLIAVNLTIHHCNKYATDGTSEGWFTNCLLVDVTNILDSIYTNSSYFLTNDAGIFQTVGAASHYLATGSPYQGAGTTNIGTNLLADLETKTTYPPLVYTNTLPSGLGECRRL